MHKITLVPFPTRRIVEETLPVDHISQEVLCDEGKNLSCKGSYSVILEHDRTYVQPFIQTYIDTYLHLWAPSSTEVY